MTTWISPEQHGPAPMPIVGMASRSVMARASSAGTSSSTTAKAPGLLDGHRIGEERPGRLPGAALDPVAAELADRLRRQADVAHDRDAAADDGLDRPARADAALDLDGLRVRVAEEAPGVLDRLLHRDAVAQEGHVADDEGAPRAADDGARVVEHLVELTRTVDS